MKLSFVTLLLFVYTLTACGQPASKQEGQIAKDISVLEFNRLLKSKPGQLIDVRTAGEVSKGAIEGSTNIDLFDENFESKIDKLDKNKPVYVYCASGGRSGEAMEMMTKKGFKEVYNLDGGYSAWKKASEKQ
ncbi:MAG: rhodanese-like domain-containing protein [Bacteroidetes bacterium]|nr:rhodanese-like domain-containing protein [Bacteroidota bacterium]